MSGPYRDADGTACPRCQAILVADELGDLECRDGCGRWITRAALDRLFGEQELESIGRIPYWKMAPFAAASCPRCHVALEDIYAKLGDHALSIGQCAKHGVWLERATREELERAYADRIAAHTRSLRLRAATQTGRIEAASRIEVLESRIVMLERRITELEGLVANLRFRSEKS